MSAMPHAIVTARGRGWARFRVRGLLRNPGLAQRMAAAAGTAAQISSSTGTARLPISPSHDEAHWLRWLQQFVPELRGAEAPSSSASSAAETAPGRGAGKTFPGAAGSRPTADDLSSAAHAASLASLLRQLATGDSATDLARGFSASAAAARLQRDGRNVIEDLLGRSDAEILAAQFKSLPVALLGGSAVLSLATRAWAEAAAIAAVLGTNAALGFSSERRAEQTVTALRKLGPRQARVWRDGQVSQIDAGAVVAGDVLLLQPGEPVAADARVIEAHRLATNEAALTGESLPVRKAPHDALPRDTPLGERRNMVFMGTVVSGGAGRALVVATGERTVLGQVRRLAQAAESPRTRLQEELDRLGRKLGLSAAALCVLVFAIGLLRGRPLLPLLRTAVSLGVAAIPEGLPTVATSLLADSVRALRERQVYARRLEAVESLGAVDTVCFDKTGTLTLNRMSVEAVSVGVELVEVTVEAATAPRGLPPDALTVALLCHTVERVDDGTAADGPRWQGSATEIALIEYACARGAEPAQLPRRHPRLSVRHRSEHHPYMVTLHADGAGLLVAVKGRPDAVLDRCVDWHDGQRVRPLTAAQRTRLLSLNDTLSARGQRVLALAVRRQATRRYGDTGGLIWLGLAGMADPLRPGLPEMMMRFESAGIRPMMITGDQLGTAQAVARAAGLNGSQPMRDAAALPEDATRLEAIAADSHGFARTSPAMKLEIVRALQRSGRVVAMTGDGINDGPALKTADVGVAMGVSGTDFAHAMSDLVLKDDHPAGLLHAIAQGRTAYLNIRKSVRYLVATNLSELMATTLTVAAGAPEPIEPLQMLWINIATDIWPAVALGLDPAEPGVLDRPPISLKEGLLDRAGWADLGIDAGAMTLAALASFGWGLLRHGPGPRAGTLAFTTLTSAQLLYALSMRSERPLRLGGLTPNPTLSRAVSFSLLAQSGTILLPPLRRLLRTTPIAPLDLIVVAAAAVLPLVVREGVKEWRWHRDPSKSTAASAGVSPVDGEAQAPKSSLARDGVKSGPKPGHPRPPTGSAAPARAGRKPATRKARP
ncbi:MAG: cation-transporting P-type ATPase [Rubrivivax sp.]|nr:cation-transporting P-type ATPase [Rubrivivax sp.]